MAALRDKAVGRRAQQNLAAARGGGYVGWAICPSSPAREEGGQMTATRPKRPCKPPRDGVSPRPETYPIRPVPRTPSITNCTDNAASSMPNSRVMTIVPVRPSIRSKGGEARRNA
jgi:hypothetical protein